MQESANPDGPGRVGLGKLSVAESDHNFEMTPPGKVKRAGYSRVRLLAFVVAMCVAGGPQMSLAAVADWDPSTRDLFNAIEAGDLVAVQRAVLDGAKLNATDDTGKTP